MKISKISRFFCFITLAMLFSVTWVFYCFKIHLIQMKLNRNFKTPSFKIFVLNVGFFSFPCLWLHSLIDTAIWEVFKIGSTEPHCVAASTGLSAGLECLHPGAAKARAAFQDCPMGSLCCLCLVTCYSPGLLVASPVWCSWARECSFL